jgi:hypothetical protein
MFAGLQGGHADRQENLADLAHANYSYAQFIDHGSLLVG